MKVVLFDIDGVVLTGPDEENLAPDYFSLPELECLINQDVSLYGVTSIDKWTYRKLLKKFPILRSFQDVLHVPKIFEISDFGHRLMGFLSENKLRPETCVYAFRDRELESQLSNTFYLLLRDSIGVDPLLAWRTEELRTRLIAHGVFWPHARSATYAITPAERSLAAKLLQLISKLMCKIYYQLRLDNVPSDTRVQDEARKGALITHIHTTAFERTVHCMKMWGIVSHVSDITFRLEVDAEKLPANIFARSDLNREMFAWALEAFFDLDTQYGWSRSPIGISSDLIVLFKSTGLLTTSDNKLCWTDRMEPYFHCCIAGMRDSESAHEFFAKIVTDKRVSHTLQ